MKKKKLQNFDRSLWPSIKIWPSFDKIPSFVFQSWKVKNLNTTSVYYNTPVVSKIGVH